MNKEGLLATAEESGEDGGQHQALYAFTILW